MTGDGAVRAITSLFFRDGTRRPEDAWGENVSTPGPRETVGSTKAFDKFLACLSDRQNPTLLDLGPVVGSNVEFFGERLHCKLFIEDLYADLERLKREEMVEWQPYFRKRFQAYSVDGVLCWDIFDHLEPQAAAPLAYELSHVLRPGGALLGFFSTTSASAPYFRFILEGEATLRHQPYGPNRPKRRTLPNRDIFRMFDGLSLSDSFLLKSRMREVLFRKPAADGRG